MSSATPDTRTCTFCGRSVKEWLELERFGTQTCGACATRLGRLLVDAPEAFFGVWPSLIEEESDEPEPKLRMPDGSSIEVRERTAELKKDLTVEARLQLAHTYGELGMHREQVLECGVILSLEPSRELAQGALKILTRHKFTAPDAIDRLRPALFPV